MIVSGHAFVAGQPGTYQEIYCQAPPEPGTEPIPGVPLTECGWLEKDHALPILSAEEQAATDQAEADELIKKIGGWAA